MRRPESALPSSGTSVRRRTADTALICSRQLLTRPVRRLPARLWSGHFPLTPFELSRLRRQACGGGSILGRRIADTASLRYAYRRMAPANLLLDDSRKLQNTPKLINPHKAILLPNPKS